MAEEGAVAPTHLPQELEDTPLEPAPLVYVDTQADQLEEAAEEGAMFCEI